MQEIQHFNIFSQQKFYKPIALNNHCFKINLYARNKCYLKRFTVGYNFCILNRIKWK